MTDSEATDTATIPEGYVRMPEGLGFGDRLQPLYRRVSERDLSLGFVVGPQHVNMMGICHGGALMTLADMAAASSLHLGRGEAAPAPTINLTFDFQSPGRLGRWLHTRADNLDVKRRFGFSSGVVLDGDTIVMRYSGSFYFPSQESGLSASREAIQVLLGDDAPF